MSKCGAEDQNGDNCGVCGASYNVLDVKKPISIISNTVPIKKKSEHIFFDLPQKNKMLKDFLKNVVKVGNYLKSRLDEEVIKKYPALVSGIRGKGLMLGIESKIKNEISKE